MVTRLLCGTHPFIQIPAPTLTALRRLRHALVSLEVPVQMACLLLFPLLIGRKTPTACPAAVRLILIKSRNEAGPRSDENRYVNIKFLQVVLAFKSLLTFLSKRRSIGR